jgi:hypothetical protein
MKSMRDHLTAEEIAAYASRSLSFAVEHEIDDHAAVCDGCLSALINVLWDRLERTAGLPVPTNTVVRAW